MGAAGLVELGLGHAVFLDPLDDGERILLRDLALIGVANGSMMNTPSD